MMELEGVRRKKNPGKGDLELEFNNLQYGMSEFLILSDGNRFVQVYSDALDFPARDFFIEYAVGVKLWKRKKRLRKEEAMKLLTSFLKFSKLSIGVGWEKSEIKDERNSWGIGLNKNSFWLGMMSFAFLIMIMGSIAAVQSGMPWYLGLQVAGIALPYLLGVIIFSYYYYGKWAGNFISWLSVKIGMPSDVPGTLRKVVVMPGIEQKFYKRLFLEVMLFLTVIFGAICIISWLGVFVLFASLFN